ncbi:MAG: lipid A phosphate methyltransferase [Bacteroidetes bacterium]|nr:MAG: lipid A phosphate methyltransferase [Bacteroidota bacterium]
MALKEEYIKSGNWLFKRRSYLPLILLVIFIFGLKNYKYLGNNEALDDYWEIFCLLVSFIGLGIRSYTIGHTPKGTSGRNTKGQVAETLNTKGIYSVVRHPLYLGNFIIWFGISLFAHSWWLSLICILVFWVYYERIMFAEENFLIKKFGKQYMDWAEKTPAFIPKLKGWEKSNLPFSFRNVLKREYNGFFSIIVVFTFLEVLSDFIVNRKLEIDLMWLIIFGVGLIIFLTLRTLKKKTNILSVKDR